MLKISNCLLVDEKIDYYRNRLPLEGEFFELCNEIVFRLNQLSAELLDQLSKFDVRGLTAVHYYDEFWWQLSIPTEDWNDTSKKRDQMKDLMELRGFKWFDEILGNIKVYRNKDLFKRYSDVPFEDSESESDSED